MLKIREDLLKHLKDIQKQKTGNFYANALLSTLYGNGLGVEFDEKKKSINLLKDVEDVDQLQKT